MFSCLHLLCHYRVIRPFVYFYKAGSMPLCGPHEIEEMGYLCALCGPVNADILMRSEERRVPVYFGFADQLQHDIDSMQDLNH